MTEPNQNQCPHGAPIRKWSFNFAMAPRAMQDEARRIVILNSDACPDCLTDRIKNLREAVRLILSGCKADEAPDRRRSFEDGIKRYYDDMKGWL